MNKVINLFSLFLLVLYFFFTIGSLYELGYSVYKVSEIPFINHIITGLSILVLLVGLIRIRRRREGKKDIRGFSKFTFETPISNQLKQNGTLFLAIEIIFALFFIVILLVSYPIDNNYYILPMLTILAILASENIVYLIQFITDKTDFKIGISNQLVAYFDREMHLYYYDGLQRIEIYHGMINFKYKKDLNLFLNLDVIPDDKKHDFLTELQSVVATKNVFFDDSFNSYLIKLKS